LMATNGLLLGRLFLDYRSFFALADTVEFALEAANVAELAVNAGETDVGYLVDFGQAFHDQLADVLRADFWFAAAVQLAFDARHEAFQLQVGHAGLFGSVLQAFDELFAAEQLAVAVALDDDQAGALQALVGRETIAAVKTLPAAPDGVVIGYVARFHHLVV